MTNKQAIGRPQKVNYTVMSKLEDALRSGTSITEACAYANISRDTYYRHYNNGGTFTERINLAKSSNKSVRVPDFSDIYAKILL